MTAAPHPDRRLRILVYANVERDEAGGAQAVVGALRDYLLGCGHRVSTGWNSASEQGRSADQWVEHFPVRSGRRRWLHLPSALRLLSRLLRERPDVVNIHFASASARYFYIFAPWLGYRTVLTCHGSDVLRPLPQDVPHLAAIFSGADAVIAVSQDIASRIEKTQGGQAVTVIANGVDTRFWHPAPGRAPETDAFTGRIIAVGRLEQVKGLDLLIQALARLRAAGVDASLTLVGEGSQRAVLEDQACAAQIADWVEFTGRLTREEVRDRLHDADMFVLPSRSEGTPLALLEAMATGTACIAARVGGVPASTGKAALLIPAEDPAALSAAIADLFANPDVRSMLGDAARRRAIFFSVAETHRAYEALFIGMGRAGSG